MARTRPYAAFQLPVVWIGVVVTCILSPPNIHCLAWTSTANSRRRRPSLASSSSWRRQQGSQHQNCFALPSSSDSDNESFMMQKKSREQSSSIVVPLPQSYDAVLFDIDGTLADSWKLGYEASLVVLERNGLPSISPETYHACTRYPTPDRLARHAGSFEPGTVEFDRLGRRLAREFDDLYVGLVNTQTAGFFPGISGVLERIVELNQRREDDTQRGTIQLGALTNACVAYAHAVLNVNTLEVSSSSPTTPASSHFASIHGADTVPAPKPEPDGLWLVCRELGVAPERAVYVGDSPSDAMAAHGAGMASIGVLWGSHSKEGLRRAPFTRLCSSVDELCELLRL